MGKTPTQERPGRIEYLYLTEPQKRAVENMNYAIDRLEPHVRLRCQTPEVRDTGGKKVVYFPHTDYDERTPPTEWTARLMCMTKGVPCPLAELCNNLGQALEAPTGVWGGRTFVDGKDYYKKEETHG